MKKLVKGKISKNINSPKFNENAKIVSTPTAYDIFMKCISRADNLISFSRCVDNKKCETLCNNERISDCYRASIVLAVSAFDSFIRQTIISKVINEIIYKRDKKISEKLKRYIISKINFEDCFEEARKDNFYKYIENEINKDLNIPFQNCEKISYYFDILGYKQIFNNVAKKINEHKDNVIENFNKYMYRRHSIVHSGDYNNEQTGEIKEIEIDIVFAKKCIEFIKKITLAINDITESKK